MPRSKPCKFTPIGGAVPNRGVVSAPSSHTGQPDISIFGLTYLQRVSDQVTNEALHIEPGMWINVPPTTVLPPGTGETVVRMGTIPHGDSILAQSTLILTVPTPSIAPVSSKPVAVDGKPLPSCS